MSGRVLMCVHPHPDDESIACGGLLARSRAQGIDTVVVTCTGGEEGENLAGIDLGDRPLAEHRERELADALAILNVTAGHQLGYRDSGMDGTPGNQHPDSFLMADTDDAAQRLAVLMRQYRPQVVVSDDEHGTYGHPDHIKAHSVTTRAVELAADPEAGIDGQPWKVAKRYVHALSHGSIIQMHHMLLQRGLASPFGEGQLTIDELEFGVPDELVTTQVDVRPWLETKREAMAAHRSQIGPESFFLNLPDDVSADVFGYEQYVRIDPGGEIAVTESDVFDGVEAGL